MQRNVKQEVFDVDLDDNERRRNATRDKRTKIRVGAASERNDA